MTKIAVRLTPRSARTGIGEWRDGELRVHVSAPPVDGRANEALVRLLAETLSLAPSCIRLVAGAAGRRKMVEIEGLSQAEVIALLSNSTSR